MATFVIAGKADDPSFARADYAAKQMQALVPNVFVHLEMKHPEHWRDFITTIFRMYDFRGFSDDFAGPLVWTLEGELVGTSADFVQKICMEKFGVKDPPVVTDPVFKQIAADNLKQVKLQLEREKHGAPLSERVDAAYLKTLVEGKLSPMFFEEQKQFVLQGACMEVWTCTQLSQQAEESRKVFAESQPARVEEGVRVCGVGQDESHVVLLHPMPLVPKHVVLVPQRFTQEITSAQLAKEVSEEDGSTMPDLSEEERWAVSKVEIQPHKFRTNLDEELSLPDFVAAMELLLNVGGVATWSAIRGGSEYRHPLDTYVQVLPFPLHSAGEDSPLRYPLELHIERELAAGSSALAVFPFTHVLKPVAKPSGSDESDRSATKNYAKAALQAYEAAVAAAGSAAAGKSRLVAFTTSWLLLMPLDTPEVGSARHEAWLKMPPLHPCALCGVVVSPPSELGFPEAAGAPSLKDGRLVSTRAEEEGILEESPEFEAASREVRISSQILQRPAETVGIWAIA